MIGTCFFRGKESACAILAAIALFVSVVTGDARAEEATIAVAANFLETATEIAERFEAVTDCTLVIASGSTGQLYAKIINGAPFDVFLAADQKRPALLVDRGYAQEGSRFTYAIGVLTLYAPDPARITGPDILDGPFAALSIANPNTAPYGAAAQQVLAHLSVADRLTGRVAQAQNVSGAFAAIKSGAADFGFVALSSVLSIRNDQPGSRWDPPQDLYDPIRQDAVLLTRGADNGAARAFLTFLGNPSSVGLIESRGYRRASP